MKDLILSTYILIILLGLTITFYILAHVHCDNGFLVPAIILTLVTLIVGGLVVDNYCDAKGIK